MEDQATKEQGKKSGCTKVILLLVAGIAGLFFFDVVLNWVFNRAVTTDELSSALVPFQNHFHAFTANFVTNEELTSEFSSDVGAFPRIFTFGIVAMLGCVVITVIVFMIPPLKKLMDNIVYILYLPALILAIIYAEFLPKTKTVFDRDTKEMVVTTHRWIFIPSSERIPFDSITNVEYKLYDDGGHYGDDTHSVFSVLYVYAGERKLFIGENQMPSHAPKDKDWKDKLNTKQSENAVAAIRQIVGLK